MDLKIIFMCFFLSKVNLMAIQGPVLTRYDPCGLGVIHFDKLTSILWQGVVSLHLYKMSEVEVEVSFKNQMVFYGVSRNSTVTAKNDGHDFILVPKEGEKMPDKYYFYVSINETGVENVPVVTKFRLNNMTLCDDFIKASQTIASLNATKANDTHIFHVCGRRSLDNEELISVRTESEAGDWPWHVALLVDDGYTQLPKYQCGGNIISMRAVLTAAHCLYSNGILIHPYRFIVEAGVIKLKDVHQVGRQSLQVHNYIIHPAFRSDQATSDLAVILVKRFIFNEYVQPICIWGPVYDKTALFGQQAAVVGFGATEHGKLSDKLRSAYTMVQNDTTCIAHAPQLYGPLLNEFTFCAGFGPTTGINPRNGDSGGGLVVASVQSDHKISWFLRGILSKCGVFKGQTECDPRLYVVYTDVGPHYGWIYHNSGLFFRSNKL